MANDDVVSALGGLRPSEQPYGNIKRSYYRLAAAATGSPIYVGQPMDLDASGQAILATAGTAITVWIVGPALGFSLDDQGKGGLPDAMNVLTQGAYWPAGAVSGYVCIADDPNQEFIIQEASTGTALGTANIGQSSGFVFTTRSTSGNNYTGSSYAELHPTTASATTAGPLQLLGYADLMNSDGTHNGPGVYAKWRVRIRNHRFGNFLAGTNIQ